MKILGKVLVRQYEDGSWLICDMKCDKAFGINNRPKKQLSDDDDDYYFLPDSEVGIAPDDPGTYEGGFGKSPLSANKWCYRECERSATGDCFFSARERIKNYENPLYNQPFKHSMAQRAAHK